MAIGPPDTDFVEHGGALISLGMASADVIFGLDIEGPGAARMPADEVEGTV